MRIESRKKHQQNQRHFRRKSKLLSMNRTRKLKMNRRKMEKNIRNIIRNIDIHRKARNIIEAKIKKRKLPSIRRQHLLSKSNHNIDFRFFVSSFLNLYAKENSLLFMYLFSFVLFVSLFFFVFDRKIKFIDET